MNCTVYWCAGVVDDSDCTVYWCAGVVDDSLVAHRPRESNYPMISVDKAIQIVMAEADVVDVETVHLTGNVDLVCCLWIFKA